MEKGNPCKNCPWRHPETCKVCQQDREKLELPDGNPKPDMTKYGLFYVTKLSMN